MGRICFCSAAICLPPPRTCSHSHYHLDLSMWPAESLSGRFLTSCQTYVGCPCLWPVSCAFYIACKCGSSSKLLSDWSCAGPLGACHKRDAGLLGSLGCSASLCDMNLVVNPGSSKTRPDFISLPPGKVIGTVDSSNSISDPK